MNPLSSVSACKTETKRLTIVVTLKGVANVPHAHPENSTTSRKRRRHACGQQFRMAQRLRYGAVVGVISILIKDPVKSFGSDMPLRSAPPNIRSRRYCQL